MLKHLLRFVFENPRIPVEVGTGILSMNKTKTHRRSPFHGTVSTQIQTLPDRMGGKTYHVFLMYPDKKGKPLQAGLFMCLTFGQCGCDI